jgi:FkbM family methyltransferase
VSHAASLQPNPPADFHVLGHPLIDGALAEFQSESEEGTRQFFDAALPACDAMIDIGAHVGLTTLYAAARVARVTAFEPSPVNYQFLTQNVALNPALAPRITLRNCGLSDRDETLMLYAKGFGDSGTSIFQDVERARVIRGAPLVEAQLLAAEPALRALGVSPRTLVKIDTEGAEYRIVPDIARLLKQVKPFLHLSFHPFNLVAGPDPYATTLLRLHHAIEMAAALAHYRQMYFHRRGRWIRVGPEDRLGFLQHYLLQPKDLPGLATPQYGFIDAVGFSEEVLPTLGA